MPLAVYSPCDHKELDTTEQLTQAYHHVRLLLLLSRFSNVWFCVTLWTSAHQASLSMGFSRQEYWSRLPCPPPGDLPDPGIEPASPLSPALAGGFFTPHAAWEALTRSGWPKPRGCVLMKRGTFGLTHWGDKEESPLNTEAETGGMHRPARELWGVPAAPRG